MISSLPIIGITNQFMPEKQRHQSATMYKSMTIINQQDHYTNHQPAVLIGIKTAIIDHHDQSSGSPMTIVDPYE